jgi:hypothetical protein
MASPAAAAAPATAAATAVVAANAAPLLYRAAYVSNLLYKSSSLVLGLQKHERKARKVRHAEINSERCRRL